MAGSFADSWQDGRPCPRPCLDQRRLPYYTANTPPDERERPKRGFGPTVFSPLSGSSGRSGARELIGFDGPPQVRHSRLESGDFLGMDPVREIGQGRDGWEDGKKVVMKFDVGYMRANGAGGMRTRETAIFTMARRMVYYPSVQ